MKDKAEAHWMTLDDFGIFLEYFFLERKNKGREKGMLDSI